ncbi:hypothetical protein BOTBODRAFT_148476 [Botryobasidium botryosum FD-172 SS1]|uniref:MutL C-terminal dimerisation domain-containing protein n=1 Tax=Botryobasidium botryosum (strain FD-172 SS1) TaxID=930990 RepID=A0A067MAK1_BOTB1|nr:hypothetical protein BOTBODRAFT_148476 [Botryobasidium botryosum FD-172 SS1]
MLRGTPAQIEPLPPATRSKLRSTQILVSLPQIILELVENSLDAGANRIDIGVDLQGWACWVRDDGTGMTREDMSNLGKGSLEARYGTSKVYSPISLEAVSTFGFRGEALASAADLSCLEICTRTANDRDTWSVILKGGETLYYGTALRWRRERPGTVVCVRDAFYNLPVRRLSHPPPGRAFELIRRDLEAIALICPHISFSLENTAKASEGVGQGRLLTISKSPSSVAMFRQLYGRDLVEHVDHISLASGEIRVDGFISNEGAHTKAYQFVYVNRHLLAPCELHRLIENKFASSSFGKHDDLRSLLDLQAFDDYGESRLPHPSTRRAPRKAERRPVYLLHLQLPPRSFDICLEPAKAAVTFEDSEFVSGLLSSVVQSFLVRHHYVSAPSTASPPVSTVARTRDAPRSKRKHSEEIADSGDDGAGAEGEPAPKRPQHRSHTHKTESTTGRRPSPTVPLFATLDGDSEADSESAVEWTDPNTGECFVVDRRTGNSHRKGGGVESASNETDGPANRPYRFVDTTWLSLPGSKGKGKLRTDPCCEETIPSWIRETLETWENPVFHSTTEDAIPSLSQSLATMAVGTGTHNCNPVAGAAHFDNPEHRRLGALGQAHLATQKLNKDDLLSAKVINQVDRKFIACVIDPSTNDSSHRNADAYSLILVDQHAADERIRVERFLRDFCNGFLRNGIERRDLSDQPRPILLTRREATALISRDGHLDAFARWGFDIVKPDVPAIPTDLDPQDDDDTDNETDEDGYIQVLVKGVPEVVSDKLLSGDELREVMRGLIAKLDTGEADSWPAPNSDEVEVGDHKENTKDHGWLKALRWCPRELLDLINSKACRGAIMFNDSLTVEQCERLLTQLADTAFPFQCAHGRPSLVPLAGVSVIIGTPPKDSQRRVHRRAEVDWTAFPLRET